MTKKIAFTKISNEGSRSPLMARLFLGMCKLRDGLLIPSTDDNLKESVRDKFDRQLQPLFRSAQAVRDAAAEVETAIDQQVGAVRSGEAVSQGEDYFNIDRSIDEELARSVDKLLLQSVITTKNRLQGILRDPLNLEIGFLFQTDRNFVAGINKLEEDSDEDLALYLKCARLWHEPIQELRTLIEHGDWAPPPLKYRMMPNGVVETLIPIIENLPLDTYAVFTANRVLMFVEEMLGFAMQRLRRHPLVITEIPHHLRDPKYPARFRVWVAPKTSANIWCPRAVEAREFV